jgi:hypothetical protein
MTGAYAGALPTKVFNAEPLVKLMEAMVPALVGMAKAADDWPASASRANVADIADATPDVSVGAVIEWDAMALMVELAAANEQKQWGVVDVSEILADVSRGRFAALSAYQHRLDELFSELDAGRPPRFSDATLQLAKQVAAERKQRSTENVKSWARGLIRSLYVNR